MHTKIKLDPMQLGEDHDLSYIDFIPSSTANERRRGHNQNQFEQLLDSELKLQNLEVDGQLDEQHERLHTALFVEEHLGLVTQVINRSKHANALAVMLLDQAMPCILHMEMQIGEKILQMLLSKGINCCGQIHPIADNLQTLLAM